MQLLTYSYSFTVMNKANTIPTLHFMGKDKEFNAVTNKQTNKQRIQCSNTKLQMVLTHHEKQRLVCWEGEGLI